MATINVEMSGDEAKLFKAFQKIIEQQMKFQGATKDTNAALKKTEQAHENLGKKSEESFGSKAVAGLAAYAAGAVTIGGAIGKITEAWNNADRAREQAGGKLRESEKGYWSLTQLSGGNKTELARMMAEAKKTFTETQGGPRTLDEAQRLQVQLEHLGIAEYRAYFSKLFGTVENPAEMAENANILRTAMGERETGTLPQIVSKALAVSPGEAQATLKAASEIGFQAKSIGLSDEQLLAGLDVMRQSMGEAGAPAMKGLLQGLQKKPGFEGVGLQGALARLADIERAGIPLTPEKTLEEFPKALEGQERINARAYIKGLTAEELTPEEIVGKLQAQREFGSQLAAFQAMPRPTTQDEMRAFLGKPGAFSAYLALKMPEVQAEMDRLIKKQIEAQKTDVAAQMRAAAQAMPEIVAAQAVRVQEAGKELVSERMGVARDLSEATITRREKEGLLRGESLLQTQFAAIKAKTTRWLLGSKGAEWVLQARGTPEEQRRFEQAVPGSELGKRYFPPPGAPMRAMTLEEVELAGSPRTASALAAMGAFEPGRGGDTRILNLLGEIRDAVKETTEATKRSSERIVQIPGGMGEFPGRGAVGRRRNAGIPHVALSE